MENYIISRYVKLFEALTIEIKLELLAKLTESIKKGLNKPKANKEKLLAELFGAWGDIDDKAMIDSIYLARTISNKEISLD